MNRKVHDGEWQVTMINPFTGGTIEGDGDKAKLEATRLLNSNGYNAKPNGDFTNGKYDVGFIVNGRTVFYAVGNATD